MRLDPDERRARLVQAVWRIVQRDGVRGASVRGVAAEAGLSSGSVRYFFTTQDELLCFAMRAVVESAGRRIAAGAEARAATARAGRPIDAAMELLEQVLPLDADRLVEARVWAAFTGQALTDPALAPIRTEADLGVRKLCRDCLTGLARLGFLATTRNLDVETERLHSLLDGLTLHLLAPGIRLSTTRVRAVLREHLADLGRPQ